MRAIRRRARWLVAPAAVALVAGVFAGCSTETVTPSHSSIVAYAAIGATVANPGDSVAVVADATGKLGTPVTVGTLPSGLVLLPDGKDLLVTVKAQDQLVEVDTGSGKVVKRVGVGLEPSAVAVSPDGSTALVTNFGDDSVSVVHLPGLTAGPTVHVGGQPMAVAITPDGHQALVANYQDGTLTPIALPTLVAGAPVPVGAGPSAVSVPTATGALVADFQTSSLTPVSLPALIPLPPIALGANPTGIEQGPAEPIQRGGGPVTWVSAGFGITPVASVGGVVGQAISIGAPAQCIAVTHSGKAWVCSGDKALVQVDLASGKVTRTVALDGIPAAVVVADVVGS